MYTFYYLEYMNTNHLVFTEAMRLDLLDQIPRAIRERIGDRINAKFNWHHLATTHGIRDLETLFIGCHNLMFRGYSDELLMPLEGKTELLNLLEELCTDDLLELERPYVIAFLTILRGGPEVSAADLDSRAVVARLNLRVCVKDVKALVSMLEGNMSETMLSIYNLDARTLQEVISQLKACLPK